MKRFFCLKKLPLSLALNPVKRTTQSINYLGMTDSGFLFRNDIKSFQPYPTSFLVLSFTLSANGFAIWHAKITLFSRNRF